MNKKVLVVALTVVALGLTACGPAKSMHKNKLFYETKLSKHEGKMRWLVIERPTGSILRASHFEEDAKKLADFQNKYKQWVPQGGVPGFLTLGKI